MKKSIYFLAVGCVLALSACTSEEVVQESVRQSNAIGFQSAVGNATREITNSSLTSFNVYGYYTKESFEANPVTVFDGDKVTGSGSSWSYGTSRYWVPDARYYFYAYSCENQELVDNGTPSMTFDDDGVVSVGISGFTCTDSHQHDLIFAVNETGIVGKQSGNDNVSFAFNHVLSKVKVKFVSQFAPGYNLTISNVKLKDVYGKGDYDPHGEDDVWTATGPQNVTVSLKDGANMVAYAQEGTTPAQNAETLETYVIPHKYENNVVTISFRVDITNGETAVMSRVFTGTWKPNWVEGNAYTYTINISGQTASLEKIEFGDMNVGTWNNTNGVNLSFDVTTPATN